MACGVPLVATDGGALPEVVGNAARVVPAADSLALARAIGELLAMDSTERDRLGMAGRAHILEHFSWSRAAQETAAVYHRILDARHPGR